MTGFDNPYLAEVAGGITVGANRGAWDDRHIDALRRRDQLVKEYAWAIPNHEAIATIADHTPILEVGAGMGYWAKCIREYTGDFEAITATELTELYREMWTEVIQGIRATEAIDVMTAHGEDETLLLCWPPYDDPMAENALDAYEGDTLIYVGEGRGGCTATEAFHHQLFDEWVIDEGVAIPTYLGIHDRLEVWKR